MKRKIIFLVSFLIINIITAMAMNAAEEFDRAVDQHLRKIERERAKETKESLDSYVAAKRSNDEGRAKLEIIRIYESNGIKPRIEDESGDTKADAHKEAKQLLEIGLKCYKMKSLDKTAFAHTKQQKEQVIAGFKARQQQLVDEYNATIKKKGILKKKLTEPLKKTVFQKYPKLEQTLQYLSGLRSNP